MPCSPEEEKKLVLHNGNPPTLVQDNCGTNAKEHYPGSSSLTACHDVPAAVMPFVFLEEPTGWICHQGVKGLLGFDEKRGYTEHAAKQGETISQQGGC